MLTLSPSPPPRAPSPWLPQQRLAPKYCLWLCTDRIQWFISPTEHDYENRLVEGPEDQDGLTDPAESWHAVASNGGVRPVNGVTVTRTFNNVIKTGYLTKSPPAGAMKGWKRRFFVLLRPSEESGEARLEYYQNEESVSGSQGPKGVILLESVLSIGPGEGPSVGNRNDAGETCFRLTTADRVLELVADHGRECRMWTQSIRALLQLSGTGVGRIKEGGIQLTKSKSDKAQSCWAILDAATLRVFPSELDSGQVKNLILSVRIKEITTVDLVAASTCVPPPPLPPRKSPWSIPICRQDVTTPHAPTDSGFTHVVFVLACRYLNLSTASQSITLNTMTMTEAESWKAELDALMAGEQFLEADTSVQPLRPHPTDDPFSNFHSGVGKVQTSTIADDSDPPTTNQEAVSKIEPEPQENVVGSEVVVTEANPFGAPPPPSTTETVTENAENGAAGANTEPNPFLAAERSGHSDADVDAQRAEAEAAERARVEEAADEKDRIAAEERSRVEVETVERARVEAEEDEAAKRKEEEATAAALAQAEAASRAQREEDAALKAMADAEAAAAVHAQREEDERAAATARARADAEAEAIDRIRFEEVEATAQANAVRVEAEASGQSRVDEEDTQRTGSAAEPHAIKLAWPAESRDVAAFSVDEIVQYFYTALTSMTPHIEAVLRDNEVDGAAVLELEESDWKELFPKVGQRRKVLNVVGALTGRGDATESAAEATALGGITLDESGHSAPSDAGAPEEFEEEDIEDLLFLLEDDLAQSLTESQISEYKQAFALFDRDGDGTISLTELEQALSAAGKTPTQLELQTLLESSDRDGNGTIDFTEFLTLMEKTKGDLESRVRSIMLGHGLGDTDC